MSFIFEVWPSSLAAHQIHRLHSVRSRKKVVDFLPSNWLLARQNSEVPATETQRGTMKYKKKQ